jgi:hypothetical protein
MNYTPMKQRKSCTSPSPVTHRLDASKPPQKIAQVDHVIPEYIAQFQFAVHALIR